MTTLRVQVQLRPEARPVPPPQPARVARLLALAHAVEARIRSGEHRDMADAARKLGLTRARLTQVSNLLLLAPEIQDAILTWPPITEGRDPVTERSLRTILAVPVWERQVPAWSQLFGIRRERRKHHE